MCTSYLPRYTISKCRTFLIIQHDLNPGWANHMVQISPSSQKTFILENSDPFILNSQYHGCWWIGEAKSCDVCIDGYWPNYFHDIADTAINGLLLFRCGTLNNMCWRNCEIARQFGPPIHWHLLLPYNDDHAIQRSISELYKSMRCNMGHF